MISGKSVSIITHKDNLSVVLQALLTHVFWLQKKTQSSEILAQKIQQPMYVTFSSHFPNILSNYLNFLNLAHFPISRNMFLEIWHSDSKTTEYSVLLVFIATSSLLQDFQKWGSFICISLLLPTAKNSKIIAVVSGIYLTVINWMYSYCDGKSSE